MQTLFLDGEPPAAQIHYWLASEHRFKSKVLANRTMIRRNTVYLTFSIAQKLGTTPNTLAWARELKVATLTSNWWDRSGAGSGASPAPSGKANPIAREGSTWSFTALKPNRRCSPGDAVPRGAIFQWSVLRQVWPSRPGIPGDLCELHGFFLSSVKTCASIVFQVRLFHLPAAFPSSSAPSCGREGVPSQHLRDVG
jgi:hypothetical protein